MFNYSSSSASIKLVDPQDVSVGHSLPLSDCHCRIRNGSDGFQPGLDGEGCSSIVHDGAVVIWSVLVVGVLFLEVVGHIRRHVLPVDLDILVTIAPGLLVVEAQGMIELMLNDAVIHTALPFEGDHLFATSSTKRRVAPERSKK